MLTIKLDGKDLEACKTNISEGPFHCEISRYLIDGAATITVTQAAEHGDPSFVKLNAKPEPTTVQPAFGLKTMSFVKKPAPPVSGKGARKTSSSD
jgi:hypothetical protein